MTFENYVVRSVHPGVLTGRRKIKTNVQEVTTENVRKIVEDTLAIHAKNACEIDYLYKYYCGKQDILEKRKFARENINNKVTVNIANAIVTYKTSYLLNEPIQYISHSGEKEVSDEVNRLNEYMRAEDKESKDKEIVDWMHICGIAERLILDDKDYATESGGAPFSLFTLDPRNAYVIYHSGIGEKPLAGVILQRDEEDRLYADVYTDKWHFVLTRDGQKTYKSEYGSVPLIEYPNNAARMGAFEPVIPILNAINQLESDALDSIQDFVNGFDVFQNCDIEDGEYGDLSIGGKAVKIKTVTQGAEAKVYRVSSEINQGGVQTRIDDLKESYLTISGMPNRNGGLSTSDTGTAVIFRDGHAESESRAKDTEKLFKRSERQMLRIALTICDIATRGVERLKISLADIKTEFLRKNLTNAQSKAQILCELLNNPMIHPKLAFEAAALFKDNEEAYRISMDYYEKKQEEKERILQEEVSNARAIYAGRQDNPETEPEGDQTI